jgi:N-acetylmuramoyl-L-alanine amidase
MVRKSLILLLSLIAIFFVLMRIPAGISQALQPDVDQIQAFLKTHPLVADTNATIRSVTLQGEGLVIDFSVEILPDAIYDEALFIQLQQDLNQALQIDRFYVTTFKVEGLPLEFWGRDLPDFEERVEELPEPQEETVSPGPLAGVRVALSPGHGIYWDETFSAWIYQRAEFWGIREDTLNAEIMRYLQWALISQGATVIPLRELDKSAPPGASGFPAWYEASRHYAIALDLPSWVYNGGSTNFNSDIRARPYMANYFDADILISLHNNGWNGTYTGTETYWDINNNPGLSSALANAVHGRMINNIRESYDPLWTDRGVIATNWRYGEIYFAQMPAILVELAFMDHPLDNSYLQQEAFKALAARAITAGICDYKAVSCQDIRITPPGLEYEVFLPLVQN